MLDITEIFPSLQGEGVYIGTRMVFVREGGCNLRCDFCDTKYAQEKGQEMSEDDIVKKVLQYDIHWVDITGGEPLIQSNEELVEKLHNAKMQVMVETNGTIFNQALFERIDVASVSPKLQAIMPEILAEIYRVSTSMYMKFVICGEKDIFTVYNILYKLNHIMPLNRIPVILQPNGMVPDADYLKNLSALWHIIQDPSWSFLDIRVIPQLHRVLFGQKRGI